MAHQSRRMKHGRAAETATINFKGEDDLKKTKASTGERCSIEVCLYGIDGNPSTYIDKKWYELDEASDYPFKGGSNNADKYDRHQSDSSLGLEELEIKTKRSDNIDINKLNLEESTSPNNKNSSGDDTAMEMSGLSKFSNDVKKKSLSELSNGTSATARTDFDQKENSDRTPPSSPTIGQGQPPKKPTKRDLRDQKADVYRVEDIGGLSINQKQKLNRMKDKIPDFLDELEGSQCLASRWDRREKVKEIEKRKDNVINLHELRRLASQGITDKGSHRAVAWRVLLGYLPPETSKWKEVLDRDRTLYRTLVSELFVRPSHTVNDLTGTEGIETPGNGIKKDESSSPDKNSRRENLSQTNVIEEDKMMDFEQLSSNEKVEKSKINEVDEGFEALSETTKKALRNRQTNSGSLHDEKLFQKNKVLMEDSVSYLDTSYLTKTKTTFTAEDYHKKNGNKTSINGNKESIENTNIQVSKKDLDANDLKRETVKERRRITSNNYKANLIGKDAPIPVHIPEDVGAMVPARIREQWKRSGRDVESLASMGGVGYNSRHMNTLLVVDDEGYIYDGRQKNRVSVNDNPLSVDNDSKWAQFFENASLLDEIRKDVVRTHPDLHFFLEPENQLGQRRYAAIERILFVWAKLNKGVRYVQGMNEIVGTIFFVLSTDTNEDWSCEAEADTYFLFNTLMVEMRDVFVPDLDDADTGIQGRIANMIALLSLHDPEVRCHLDETGIDPSFYSIRWLTTLLSREFCIPDTIRLWDSMFASTHKDNFLRYVCVSMVMIIRETLLKGDFGACLKLLQSYPPTDVDQLLESSRSLWIYESQITLACHKGGISLAQALATIVPPGTVIMAYGLHGGVAIDQIERMRQAKERGLSSARGVARDASVTVATAGRGFFSKSSKFFDMFGGDKNKRTTRQHSV